jgi:hypothetical protein
MSYFKVHFIIANSQPVAFLALFTEAQLFVIMKDGMVSVKLSDVLWQFNSR